MARKVRIEDAGFHYILNRGVNRGLIFNSIIDKEKFLEIVCEVSTHYYDISTVFSSNNGFC